MNNSNPNKSASQLPTVDKPQVTTLNEEQTDQSLQEMKKDIGSMANALQTIGNVSENAIKKVTGMLANIATYNSTEKMDFDGKGKQIVESPAIYKKRYRSTENINQNKDIKEQIEAQEKELEEARNAKADFTIHAFTEQDLMEMIAETQNALEERIFGPLWNNWTNGKDFLGTIKDSLEEIINTFDPLMDLVDQLEDFLIGNIEDSLSSFNVHMGTTKNGGSHDLPLGAIALRALRTLIDYIRELIRNIEMLAEEYTVEELNVLLRKGTSGQNWTGAITMIRDLIQLIINAIKPYIQNLVMALILDAIDMIVDALDKAGILSPKGPLKLIPIAITLVRSILKGNLEEIEEMVKQSIIKLINLFQLAVISIKDPSILWADTDRMDKEIAVARYKELTEDGDFSKEDRDKFFNRTETNYSASVRYYLQKMKNETSDQFDQVADMATTYTDLNILYKNAVAANGIKKKNQSITQEKIKEAEEQMIELSKSIARNLEEPKN